MNQQKIVKRVCEIMTDCLRTDPETHLTMRSYVRTLIGRIAELELEVEDLKKDLKKHPKKKDKNART